MARKKSETPVTLSEDVIDNIVPETKIVSLEERIKKITTKIDTLKAGIDNCGCGQGDDPFGLVRASADWIEIVQDPEFTSDDFLRYQNYLKLQPELLKVFLASHEVDQSFIETFYKVKLWKLEPDSILKTQSQLNTFINKNKDDFNKEAFDKWSEQVKQAQENLSEMKEKL